MIWSKWSKMLFYCLDIETQKLKNICFWNWEKICHFLNLWLRSNFNLVLSTSYNSFWCVHACTCSTPTSATTWTTAATTQWATQHEKSLNSIYNEVEYRLWWFLTGIKKLPSPGFEPMAVSSEEATRRCPEIEPRLSANLNGS